MFFMKQHTFTSKEVSLATGATLRRLQWWEQKGLVVAKFIKGHGRSGRCRSYTNAQVKQIKRLVAIRANSTGPLSESAQLLKKKRPVMVIVKPTLIHGVYVVPKAIWKANAA
jgi:DNA-binding transcriptional MerR regulator